MAQESITKKISRVRPPRVHITYDVETGGAIEKRELPFVVGILADLSGAPDKALPPVSERKFVDIDRDNFNDVMKSIEPRIVFEAKNTLEENGEPLGVELRFKHMNDFRPAQVASQIPALRKLLDERKALANIQSSLMTNKTLDAMLQQTLNNTDTLNRISAEEGLRTQKNTENTPGGE